MNFLSGALSTVRRLDRHTMERLARRLITGLRGEDLGRADGRCALSPEWLILGVNNVCNLHCKMCDVGLGENGTAFWANLIRTEPAQHDVGLLHGILRQARAFRPRPHVSIGSTEPLIHPEIVEFTRAIVREGLYCVIISNGTMLPRLAPALVESGLHGLALSVDGPAHVHNRIRGSRDSFEKLYRGAELLTASQGPPQAAVPEVAALAHDHRRELWPPPGVHSGGRAAAAGNRSTSRISTSSPTAWPRLTTRGTVRICP